MLRKSPTVVVLPRTETQFVTREVHEHRAPTDESVKLLREMEAAAEAKRIASLKVEGNGFNCLVQIWRAPENDEIRATAVADLNGKRIVAKATTPMHAPKRDALIVDLRNDLARRIAEEMLTDALHKLPKGVLA